MARFYGMLKGRARTIATRLGTEKSGLWASINGWTDGSNGTGIGELIAEIKR